MSGIKTGDRLVDEILRVAGAKTADLQAAWARKVEALDAVLPERRVHKRAADGAEYVELTEGGAPDWDARLRASQQIDNAVGLSVRRQMGNGETGSTVLVQIVTSLDPNSLKVSAPGLSGQSLVPALSAGDSTPQDVVLPSSTASHRRVTPRKSGREPE